MVLFVRTIDSDDEFDAANSSDEDELLPTSSGPSVARREAPPAAFDESFEFASDGVVTGASGKASQTVQASDGSNKQQSWDFESAIAAIAQTEHPSQLNTTSLDEKIQRTIEARKRREAKIARKRAAAGEADSVEGSGSDNDEDEDEDEEMDEDKSDDDGEEELSGAEEGENEEAEVDDDDDSQADEVTMEEDVVRVTGYKGEVQPVPTNQTPVESFSQLSLSRPLLRAVQAMGFDRPTPVQARSIPLILKGRDVCGSAATGSGKTAAYLLPILERLLFRPRKTAATRVLIITPTRELAQQVLSMLQKLAQFTDVVAVAIVGGLSLQVQAGELRGRPDVVVCTPGRLIDHVRNTQSVDLDDVEILVLDEADRLLELGFKDEIAELVRFCPTQRQTLMFSATMTTQVIQLSEVSLNRPIRVEADPLYDMAQKLVQEFLRIRPSCEGDREAILLALCQRTFTTQTIVFFKRKSRAHRAGVLFGLAGLRAAELHGNLTQRQRLEALQRFRAGEVDFLLCTDLAARGLDIQGVKTVLNFEMPRDMTTYVHRVGRTARAGRGGLAVTLVGEKHRKVMKDILKRSKHNVRARQVPQKVVDRCRNKIKDLEDDIRDVFKQERIEKEVRVAEMEATKASNMIVHKKDILSRPQRTWFQSEKDKLAVKEMSKEVTDRLEASAAKRAREEANAKERRKEKRKLDRLEAQRQADKVPHRMSRAKRRRKELLDAEKEDAAMAAQEAKAKAKEQGMTLSEDKVRELSVPAHGMMAAKSKAAKRQEREEMNAKMDEGLTEKSKAKKKKKKESGDRSNVVVEPKRKALFGGQDMFESEFAVGGAVSALDQRLGRKNKDKTGPVFKEQDLSKGGLKKGGKLGSAKFKSKKRFKRR